MRRTREGSAWELPVKKWMQMSSLEADLVFV
jgi:hypothetical protein